MLHGTIKEFDLLPGPPSSEDNAYFSSALFLQGSLEGVDITEDDTPGLILTAQQIVNFRKYELAARALPVTPASVNAYLGKAVNAGPGLMPADFLATFQMIHAHAGGWAPLRRDIRSTASGLQLFSGTMATFQESLLDILDEVNVRFADNPSRKPATLKALSAEGYNFNLERHPQLRMEAWSQAHTQGELTQMLRELKSSIEGQQRTTQDLLRRVTDYTDDLNDDVQPAIALKKQLVVDKIAEPGLAALQTSIDERAEQIKAKDNAYRAAVNSAIKKVAWLGPIGGIVGGVKADKLRKERNELMKVQERELDQLSAVKGVQTALVSVMYRLGNLQIVVNDASVALENLRFVWQSLALSIDESAAAAGTIADVDSLLTLKRKFTRVTKPWLDVSQTSALLLAAFDKADKDIKKYYDQ